MLTHSVGQIADGYAADAIHDWCSDAPPNQYCAARLPCRAGHDQSGAELKELFGDSLTLLLCEHYKLPADAPLALRVLVVVLWREGIAFV